jgi:reactive intermediate/imine deaminase
MGGRGEGSCDYVAYADQLQIEAQMRTLAAMWNLMRSGRLLAGAALLMLAGSAPLAAQSFSDEQADRGDQVFSRVCSQCHTRKDMASPDFRLKWNGQTAYDLFDLVRTTMPDSAPGSLSQEAYVNVTAYLMKLNGMRAGTVPLPVDSLLRRIKLDIPATAATPSTALMTLPFAPRPLMSHSLSFRSRPVSRHAASVALAALTFATPIVARAQARQAVIPAGTSASANLSPGTRVGNLVYSSGQLGMDRAAPDSTVGGQTKIALNSIKKVFETAGSSMAQALKCTVFLIDVKDFAGMNAAYQSFFPDSPPARTTVVVAALVAAGAKVEIECVAAIPGK